MELDVARVVRQRVRRHRPRALDHALPPAATGVAGRRVHLEQRRRHRHQLPHIAFYGHTALDDGGTDIADLAHGQRHHGQAVPKPQTHFGVLGTQALAIRELHLHADG